MRQRLHDIATHGHPSHYHPYFPAYLLKSIQNWFAHHGEDLYDELKHIRNALYNLDALLQQLQNDRSLNTITNQSTIEAMARTHHLLHQHRKARQNPPPHGKQLELF